MRVLLNMLAVLCNASAVIPLAVGDALAQAADRLERQARRISA